MSSPCPKSVLEVRAAFHELLDVALDRLVAPLTGGLYSTFAEIALTEWDGGPVDGVPAMPCGVAIALGARSRAQLRDALEAVTAIAAAAGDTVRTTKRSTRKPDGEGRPA